MNVGQDKRQKAFKVIGLSMLILSIILFIIAICNFSLDGGNIWILLPISMVLFPISIVITMIGFYQNLVKRNKNKIISLMQEIPQDNSDIICPKCQIVNANTNKFCKNCGYSLTKACPHCGSEINIEAKYCSNCGKVAE